MSVTQPSPSPFPESGWDFREEDPRPEPLKQRDEARSRQVPRRALLTRELRLIEGAESVNISAVEVSSSSSTWRSTSRVVVIYQVSRHDFLADPSACLAPAMDAIMRPLLEGLDRGGEGPAE